MKRGRKPATDRPQGLCKACKARPVKPPTTSKKSQSYCYPCDALRVKLILMRQRVAKHGLQAEIESIQAARKSADEREELLKIILKERKP